MKLRRLFCLICCVVGVFTTAGALRAVAQTTPSPTPRPSPPAPPFVNATPGFSAWTIVQYNVSGLGSQTAEGVIRSLTASSKPDSTVSVTKTGQIRHQLRKSKGGDQQDIWYEHGNRITKKSAWKFPLFEGATSAPNQPQGPDFPELSWITAGNFIGTQEHQGATFYVFEMQITQGDERIAKEYGYKLATVFNRAYISAETRLPWMLQTGDSLQRYFFQAPPTTVLEVPGEYQTMFDAYETKKTEMAKRPAGP